MNGYSIDPLKCMAILLVGAVAVMAIFRGDTQAGYTLAAAILGYVFGNTHGAYSALTRKNVEIENRQSAILDEIRGRKK
jgi:hypothetical protein